MVFEKKLFGGKMAEVMAIFKTEIGRVPFRLK